MTDFYTQYCFKVEPLSPLQMATLGQAMVDAEIYGYEIDAIGASYLFEDDGANEFEELVDALTEWSREYSYPITIRFAHTASRPSPDAYGGGYCVIFRGRCQWRPMATAGDVAARMMVEYQEEQRNAL